MRNFYITRNADLKIIAIDPAEQVHVDRGLKQLRELDPGEVSRIGFDFQASSALTAWHILLCKAVFVEQETFTDFRAMRQFLYTMAGYCVEVKQGRKIVRVPGSWSWDALPNDADRSDAHEKVLMAMHDADVLRVLWPAIRPAQRMEKIMGIIARAEAERDQFKARKAARQAARNARAANDSTAEAVAA